MSEGERCPGCWKGRLIARVGFQECTNVECYYTTAGHPEHDPEPSPDEYRLSTVEKWHLPIGASPARVAVEPSPEPATVERVGCGDYRVSMTEDWFLPVGASPDAVKYGTLMVDAGMIDASRYIADTVHIADRAAIDQRNLEIAEGRTKPERLMPMRHGHSYGELRMRDDKPKCNGCGLDLWQMAGGFVECPNRNCELSGEARAKEPTPEAEVTELERLRCLVKALEHEAQGLRETVAEWNQRLAITRGEWQSAKLDTELYARKLAKERSEHLSTRLKLVTALAELKALREKHGEPETGPRTERAESRLDGVAGFVFERGVRITCSEDD
jgi:hypothetical protein